MVEMDLKSVFVMIYAQQKTKNTYTEIRRVVLKGVLCFGDDKTWWAKGWEESSAGGKVKSSRPRVFVPVGKKNNRFTP